MSDDDSETFQEGPTPEEESASQFAAWTDGLIALPADYEPELVANLVPHIEVQPLRWIMSGLDLLERSKESLFPQFLPYAVFQTGAELFLKGMWLCQYQECRLVGDDCYMTELTRNKFGSGLKAFGHDLLKLLSKLRAVPVYQSDPATMRFLRIVENIIRKYYFPLYQRDKLDRKWANCRYPKRFYNDKTHEGRANAWNQFPHQWLIAELFGRMRSDIYRLWDFPNL